VKGIVVGSSNDADDGDACDNADDGDARDDADDGEACDNVEDSDEFDDAGGGFDGNGCVGAGRDIVDGSGSADDASESTRNHKVEGANLIMRLKAWKVKELRMQIWRMTCCVKQLKKVNYGIVVGLKAAQSELRRLRKAEGDVQRNKSTTVVKNNLRMVKDLVTEKETVCVSTLLAPTADSIGAMGTRLEVEVSNAADGKKVLAERVDDAGCTEVEGPQKVVLFDQWSKRQTKAAVSRAARDVTRNKHVNSRRRKKKGEFHTAFRATPTQGALFSLAPVTVNEGRGDDAILLEQEGVIFYDRANHADGARSGRE